MSDINLTEESDVKSTTKKEEGVESEEKATTNSKETSKPENNAEKPADKKKFFDKIRTFFQNPKKRLAFISILGVIIIAIFGLGIRALTHDNQIVTESAPTKKAPPVEAPKYPAILDGVMTDKDSANRHPLAIMVENHPDARPQAGLDKASVVYEAIAEGGITRFMALYGENEAEKVGPVRSTRTYYVDWAHGYDAYLAHVGGNIDALDKIPVDKILDLDQFKYSSPYWRESNGNVATEHTMFTSTTKLRGQAEKNNYSTSNNFTVYRYKDDPDASLRPDSQEVTIDFSSYEYKVTLNYDKATNSYKRSMAGKAHNDRVTGEQLNPKNIVVMTVKRQPTKTRINEDGYNMTTIGSGDAKIIMDGKIIDGSWKKENASQREIFYDDKGNEVTFDRGQLWISVIPPEGSVK